MFAAASPTEPRLNNDRGAVDKISITRTSYDGKDARGRRLWTVHVKVNDNDGISKMLTDPLTESEYSNPTGSRPGSLSNEVCSEIIYTCCAYTNPFKGMSIL